MSESFNLINSNFNSKKPFFIALLLRLWRWFDLDTYLLIGITLLSCVSLIVLYSASNADLATLMRQGIAFLIGFICMLCLARVSPLKYQKWVPWLFLVILIMLSAVLIIGAISKGAQRWLSIGLIRFQPAEVLKVVMPLMLAWYFKKKTLPPSIKVLLSSLIMILVPVFLVVKQPDLGTGIMIAAAGVSVLLFTGINIRLIIGSLTMMIISLPILWHFLHAYQKARVLTLLNPESDPLGKGYHIIQSKIAIGSGGFWGKGWLHGSQSHLQFLPEHTTDFIFSVLSEEFGLMGCFVVLAMFLFVAGRGLYISMSAQDTFSRLAAAGISLTFFFSFFVNIGMVIGILPVVGLPLPLISRGGSSIVTLMAGFGILMSLHSHQKLLPS